LGLINTFSGRKICICINSEEQFFPQIYISVSSVYIHAH
jgi:hypothetical protein